MRQGEQLAAAIDGATGNLKLQIGHRPSARKEQSGHRTLASKEAATRALRQVRQLSIDAEPGCSKLTTSLVKVSLKFQMLISQICQYFLFKKCEKLLHCKSLSHFFNKNISVFGYKVVKHLTSYPLTSSLS